MYSLKTRLCSKCGVRTFNIRSLYSCSTLFINKPIANVKTECDSNLTELIRKYQTKLIFNSYIYKEHPLLCNKKNYMLLRKLANEERQHQRMLASIEPLPIALKYTSIFDHDYKTVEEAVVEDNNIHFPYSEHNASVLNASIEETNDNNITVNVAENSEREIKSRQIAFNQGSGKDWMRSYENYNEIDQEGEIVDEQNINYGTPNSKLKVSNVPCGGCGALLHCKDTSIPGYIPSEIFRNCFRKEGTNLRSIICQRCHFLKNYNIALQVRVAREDYENVLKTIKDKFALIVLIVDLLDFPCSIWPGIAEIVGTKKPIVVVGNKVDLLPQDSRNYLEHIKDCLKESVLEAINRGGSNAHIKHVGLISAKTGWGIEELINKLHNLWRYKGDVYLVGSTNVGKSTLFNCLLQSDYCKVQAVDLVQRATTSIWPGTTLNLLKFPILRPSGWRLYVRTKRLQSAGRLLAQETKLNKLQLKLTNDPQYATLIGRIDRTFTNQDEPTEVADPFSVSSSSNYSGLIRLGINENHVDYVASKWCYDTPGVVQDTQIIHLLTTEELMLTLPRALIQPKSFNLKVGQTLFIAGIGRVDYVSGPDVVRLTVFCTNTLPITLCNTEDAAVLYEEFLGTDVFLVPKGSEERLKQWPCLKMAGPFKLIGKDRGSCGDIVLSNAGWVSVRSNPDSETVFNAWTPEGRGIFHRKSILPYAVRLKGTNIKRTPMFVHDKLYVPQ